MLEITLRSDRVTYPHRSSSWLAEGSDINRAIARDLRKRLHHYILVVKTFRNARTLIYAATRVKGQDSAAYKATGNCSSRNIVKLMRSKYSRTGAAVSITNGAGVGTHAPMMHGASPVMLQSVPLTAMVLEQQKSEPPVPGRVPQPAPPHCPQFSAQHTFASWTPANPFVHVEAAFGA